MQISDDDLLIGIENGWVKLNEDLTLIINEKINKAHLSGKVNHKRFYYCLRSQGKRRTIARAKLVYMITHMVLIPEGWQIHHIDGDRLNDIPNNLIMLRSYDHDKIHGRFKLDTDIPF